jgi:glutathione S-transferase
MTMKIWGTRNQGNPVRVAIFLAEKGIDVPFEPVDLFGGAHKTSAYLAKNPVAQVPVLELDDGNCIAETVAICRYFERIHPEPPLMGVGPVGEAVVEMWQRRIEFHFYDAARHAFRHATPFMKVLEPVQIAEWAELNRTKITEALEMMDAQLQQHRFLAGADFTIADITAILPFQILGLLEIQVPDHCPSLARWRDKVFARPSVISVMGEAG